MNVEQIMRDAQIAHDDHGDGCEGLVDLEQIDIVDRPACLLQNLADREHRGGREQGRRVRVRAPMR